MPPGAARASEHGEPHGLPVGALAHPHGKPHGLPEGARAVAKQRARQRRPSGEAVEEDGRLGLQCRLLAVSQG